MRYISNIKNLALCSVDGTVLYQFYHGVLDLGVGVTITPNFSGANSVKMFDFSTYFGATADTDIKKAGQGFLFWEAPILTHTDALTAVPPTYYRVLLGPATYHSVTYSTGDRFVTISGTTAWTGAGLVCIDVPQEYYIPDEVQFRKESFKKLNLIKGTEAAWSEDTWGAPAVDPGQNL